MTTAPVTRVRRALAAPDGSSPAGPATSLGRRSLLRSRRRDERGAATAEYAVATAGACGFAGVLIKFLTSDAGQGLISFIFGAIQKLIGSFF